MNWQAVAFDWNRARAFLAAAETGSFSAAARGLGLTQPTLGRQVAALEEELGVALFRREGRALALTEAGLDLLEHVRAMRDAAGRVSLAASGRSQSVEGHVAITASDVFAAHLLPPVLEAIRAEAPGIELEVVASNELRDLSRREADIAIRHVRPEQPDLVARLLRESEANLYASRAFLDRYGRPETPDDLRPMPFIGFDRYGRLLEALRERGLPLGRENFRIVSESGLVAWEMVRRGLGICAMMREVAETDPGIERVLPDMPPVTVPVWLVTHRELHTSRRIRLVFDRLAAALG